MMHQHPLKSLNDYSSFVVAWLDRPAVLHSTVIVWSTSPYTGVAEGEVFFILDVRLRIRQELDFDAGLITAYGYELYRHGELLWRYDDFPHPQDRTLASTFPHHKHVPPDIKHHRVPAAGISFSHPNLPLLVEEIERLLRTF
jgi:hypothetical protein